MAIGLNSYKEENPELEIIGDQLEQRSNDLGDAADDFENAIYNLRDALLEMDDVKKVKK